MIFLTLRYAVLRIRIRCLFDPRNRDPGWVKNQDPYPGSGTGMNTSDHISEFFGLKYLNPWMRIRESFWPWIQDEQKFGSGFRSATLKECVKKTKFQSESNDFQAKKWKMPSALKIFFKKKLKTLWPKRGQTKFEQVDRQNVPDPSKRALKQKNYNYDVFSLKNRSCQKSNRFDKI
jgi:hypothetical protein